MSEETFTGCCFVVFLFLILMVFFAFVVPLHTDRYEGVVVGPFYTPADDEAPSAVQVTVNGKQRAATAHKGVLKRLKAGDTVQLAEGRTVIGGKYGLRVED